MDLLDTYQFGGALDQSVFEALLAMATDSALFIGLNQFDCYSFLNYFDLANYALEFPKVYS